LLEVERMKPPITLKPSERVVFQRIALSL
jgi:hypothetical protein